MSEAQPPSPPRHWHGRPKGIKLALQGGGSHGAFTWGVLDRLLEDERLEIESISGTSAGAMNAAVLASGHASGDRQGARAALDAFWGRIGEEATWSLVQRTPFDRLLGSWRIDNSPGYVALDMLGRVFSPYQLPESRNPLQGVLEQSVDFEAIRYACRISLHICATSVRTGKVKVFENREVDIDALLASACLPFLFRAIEIKGEAYYDGGYVGNPAIWPLIYASGSRDIVIVQVNPVHRDVVPTTAREIQDRVNEITFNSSLIAEMRAINFVNRLIASGKLDPSEYRYTHMHLIDGTDVMTDLHASTKLNAEPEFLTYLKGLGRAAAEGWLAREFDQIGAAGTCNITQQYL
jgi:NTE family protein